MEVFLRRLWETLLSVDPIVLNKYERVGKCQIIEKSASYCRTKKATHYMKDT